MFTLLLILTHKEKLGLSLGGQEVDKYVGGGPGGGRWEVGGGRWEVGGG